MEKAPPPLGPLLVLDGKYLGINRTKLGFHVLKLLSQEHLHYSTFRSHLGLYLPHPRRASGVGRNIRNITRPIISKRCFLEKLRGSPPGSVTNSKDSPSAQQVEASPSGSISPGKKGENGPRMQSRKAEKQSTAGRGKTRCRESSEGGGPRGRAGPLWERQREVAWPSASGAFGKACPARANPMTFPGSLQGVPTLLFLKLTRIGLVRSSACTYKPWVCSGSSRPAGAHLAGAAGAAAWARPSATQSLL